ncbi:extracellular solute-binding protein family 1 [Spirochaeta thermophila DSM 6578]|uniref:Extracellular solute-binding protein family 1 n=1 Tax=Winmispira thermophila (strain ATCC 700085 / DSM 6578 / Z-1203) TaxID=869211 RepID=G0GAA3_WINT7|nr:extracellular solute-binding protein [Spirochaeta thermophila]AEJ60939.1 extracellular solute-binding protein family 1 [Spirochaeta thermophila DSM 6578]
MRTRPYALLVMIGLILLVTACGKQEARKPQEPVAFEFWTSQTQSDRMATIQLLVDTFQATHPEITINVIPVEENDLPTQIHAASAAGTLPGLVEMGAENAVAFGAEGLLDTAAGTRVIEKVGKDRFYEGALKLVDDGSGTYYAVPFHGWVQGLWYRIDWFEEAGLKPPSTWEDMLEAARYFYKPEENQYGILVGTKPEVYAEQCFTHIALSNNARLFDRDGNLIFDSPEMREAIEFYAELAKYTPPGPQTWRARDYYFQNKLAMFFYSTYIMDDLALAEVAQGSLTGENFPELTGAEFDPELVNKTGFVPIITHTQPAGYGVVVTMGITKGLSEAQLSAVETFLLYLFSENAYVSYLHMAPGGMNPTIEGIAETDRFLEDPRGVYKRFGKEKLAQIISGLNSIQTFSIVEGRRIEAASTIFSKQIIPQMIYAITQEGVPIDQAMREAEQKMREIVEGR